LGPYPNRGSCVFAQTSVMRKGTSRDTRQQSRLLRGNANGFEICTVDHAKDGVIRLDATVTYKDAGHEVGVFAHEHDELKNDNFMKVYSPSEGDDAFVPSFAQSVDATRGRPVDKDTVAWWRLDCGRVLGVYDNRLIEYEPSTLAPLGLVVGQDELEGRRIVVVPSGLDRDCVLTYSEEVGMEGADCGSSDSGEEQAVLLIDDATHSVTVVQPNEDGSYWRKIVRNKIVRMKEKRRVEAANAFARSLLDPSGGGDEAAATDGPTVVSSWGPYMQISGTAKGTAVPGLTKKPKVAASKTA